MARNQGSVRMGPLGLFTLVAVLCMATLCVLCIVTAQASLQMSHRYAASNQLAYQNEQAAQTWLASVAQKPNPTKVDLQTAARKAQAATGDESAVSIEAQVIPVEQAVADLGLEESVNPASYTAAIQARFEADAGKTLDVVVAMRANGSYQVLSWKAAAELSEETVTESLWSGIW